MLNYSTHAIEDLTKASKTFSLHEMTRGESKRYASAVEGLRKSEKFELPPHAGLLDISSMRVEFFDLLKLPYPVVSLEFLTPEENCPYAIAPQATLPSGVILLAAQVFEKIYLFPIAKHPTENALGLRWSLCDYQVIIDLSMPYKVVRGKNVPYFELRFPKMAGVSLDSLNEQATYDIYALLGFCCTVNCENVKTQKVDPSKALNKKRAASNREPFYSYHVIDLPNDSSFRGDHIGTHASPRLHLRRGHLRRLESGKVIWVRHCMVGNPDKGVVEKSYKLSVVQ